MLFKDWDIVLEGENIRLTSFVPEDRDAYFSLLVRKPSYSPELAAEMIRPILEHEDEDEYHAIRLKTGKEMIGWIALQREKRGEPEIGIYLLEPYRNRGYGTEAIRLLVNRVYREYGVDCVYAYVMRKNLQSRRVFEKLGAVCFENDPDDEELKRLEEIGRKLPDDRKKLEEIVENRTMYHFRINLPV